MNKFLLIIIAFISILGINNHVIGQTTITIRPNAIEGKDAFIRDLTLNSNFGSSSEFPISAWSYGGFPMITRCLIDFDFSPIPTWAVITSANLYLYNDPNSGTTNGQHSQETGTNEMYVQRIIEFWEENSVSWSNQPLVTESNEVLVPASDNPNQDYIINLTSLVQDIVNDYNNSYGFMLKLNSEQFFRSVVLASSNAIYPALHPKIEITYLSPTGINDINDLLGEIKVYPNPSNEKITVGNIGFTDITNITLIDVHGKIVFIKEIINQESIDINIEKFPKGIYIVKIQNAVDAVFKKIMIQ